MADEQFKRTIFDLVRARLVERKDSLIRFCNHWKGSASGIEGWFKLEFVAAIEPHVAVVSCGGAGGRGRGGRKYPDLVLKSPAGAEIPEETKASGSGWWHGGARVQEQYSGCVLAFLCLSGGAETSRYGKQRQKIEALDRQAQLAPICKTLSAESSFYFGMADLRAKMRIVARFGGTHI
jgi:hypothetical protein